MNKMPGNPRSVRAIVREWSDPTRSAWNGAPARPLQTMIQYQARVRAQGIAIFRTGRYALDRDAPRITGGPNPLVVVSHGTGGSAASIAWLCGRLAPAGFVVAAVHHHGATAAEPGGLTVPGAALWWERAVDLSLVLDRMRDDPVFGSVIDVERISVAGFSIGAYAALAAVGARPRIERWRPHCAAHPGSSLCRVPPGGGVSARAGLGVPRHSPDGDRIALPCRPGLPRSPIRRSRRHRPGCRAAARRGVPDRDRRTRAPCRRIPTMTRACSTPMCIRCTVHYRTASSWSSTAPGTTRF